MSDFTLNAFLERLYRDALSEGRSATDKAERVARVREMLRLDDLYSYAGALSVVEEERFASLGADVVKYSFAAAEGLRVPVYALTPADPNGRAALYLHGHDKFGVMGALAELEPTTYHKHLPVKLAAAGYTVLAPEMPGFGEAQIDDFPRGSGNRGGCQPLSCALLDCGYSTAGLRTFVASRTMDFAQTLGIDGAAVVGISGGGLTTTFAAATDERLRAVVCSGYPNLYASSTLAMSHCVDNYIPGMLSCGESADVLALACPRPLLAINGDADPIFPKAGSHAAFRILKDAYEAAGAGDALECALFDGGHEFAPDVVLDWLRRTEFYGDAAIYNAPARRRKVHLNNRNLY